MRGEGEGPDPLSGRGGDRTGSSRRSRPGRGRPPPPSASRKGSVPDHGNDAVSDGHREYDYLDWIARLTSHIPEKGAQLVHYYGPYSNAHRGIAARRHSSRNSHWTRFQTTVRNRRSGGRTIRREARRRPACRARGICGSRRPWCEVTGVEKPREGVSWGEVPAKPPDGP